MYTSLKEWIVSFESAAVETLAAKDYCPGWDACGIQVSACAKHGPGCASVTIAAVTQHIHWRDADPRHLAEHLLGDLEFPAPRPR